MVDRVSGTLFRYSMCSPGDRVAVAVSGGADSVCLLHVLVELAAALQIELSVAHLNHKLRGAESDADAEFVRGLARELSLPFVLKEVEVAAIADNLEQAGRNARLAFFSSLPVDRVATGHTRSDQAETVLYRLLRGSGTAGLAGILPVTEDRRIRPLIECSRAEVLEYLQSRGLRWREDVTNSDVGFARNRIRSELIPFLDAKAVLILARTAELARDEEDYWRAVVDGLAAEFFKREAKALILNAEELSELHPAVQRRVLRRAIQEVKGDLREIDLFHIESLAGLAAQPEGHGRMQAPGIDVFRSFEWLRIGIPRTESRSERDYACHLSVPGTTPVPGQASALRIEVAENTKYSAQDGEYNIGGYLVDADRLSGSLELRNWRPGDQITQVGHSGEKIKTLFQRARIPIWERQGWPVITTGTANGEQGIEPNIVWTRRFGVSSPFAVQPDSRRILRIVEQETDSAESKHPGSASLY